MSGVRSSGPTTTPDFCHVASLFAFSQASWGTTNELESVAEVESATEPRLSYHYEECMSFAVHPQIPLHDS